MEKRVTTRDIREMKKRGEPIPMVTAYDYTAASLADAAGIPMVLVGDSLGQVVLGYDTTLPVTIDDMVRATAAVARGAGRALVVADMPFMSYQVSAEDALRNAGRLVKEGGAHAVKLEGGAPVVDTVARLTAAGVAVMGHIGLTPQSIRVLGGYRVQGRSARIAQGLLDDALALQDAGAFAIVLELVPVEAAAAITGDLNIPTIGIGAGVCCDGQVQVLHDLLGLRPGDELRHARRYAEAGRNIIDALRRYAADVRARDFPGEAESFHSRAAAKWRASRQGGITELHSSG